MGTYLAKSTIFLALGGAFLFLFITSSIVAQTESNPVTAEEVSENVDDETKEKQVKKSSECDPKDDVCIGLKKLTKRIADALKNSAGLSEEKRRSYYSQELRISYFRRGQLYSARKQYTAALRDYNRAIEQHSDNSSYLIAARGALLLVMGKSDQAFEDFDSVIKSGSSIDARTFWGRGKIYFDRREYDNAFEDFDRAIYLDRRLADAYFGRGVIFLRRGDQFRMEGDEYRATQAFKNAVNDLNSVEEINLGKTNAETYRMLAKAYEALGNEPDSKRSRRKAEELTEKIP